MSRVEPSDAGLDRLRRAFAERRDEAAGEHPDAARLWSLAAGELEPTEAEELVDHLSSCPACAEDFRLTREMVAEAGDGSAAAGEVVPFLVPRRSRAWIGGLAALVALAVGFGLLGPTTEDPAPYRQGGEEPRIESTSDTDLPRSAARLSWTVVEGARYDLVVTTEDLEPVAEARDLEDSSWTVPEASLADLPDGTVLRWRVEAVLGDGRRLGSPVYDVVLRDGPPGE